ncbi:MAG: TerB family tellurite resistance protein, partial [Bacteroidetes bacterium]|nr:TerB family tellurite resistance protein [Bacteroidota bacterium]
MSEELIKAILQLFAIVAKEDGVQKEERSNIEEFLAENLDEEAVTGFMEWMDQYVSQSYGSKTSTMVGSDDITQDYAAIDLNCSRLNRELTHQQKMVLILKMLELILADGSISDRESRLVEHACDALKVNREEVDIFKSFVLSHDVHDINSKDLLIINSNNAHPPSDTRHLVVANLPGFVAVLRIPEIETYFIKYEGDAPINLNGVPL